ncbi:MAG TPA: DEAD/DEAH box helicase [Kineosporiaceae bacterium]|nr:DEAD/DEAH box helicase [Kineosporiaceae bacterium]
MVQISRGGRRAPARRRPRTPSTTRTAPVAPPASALDLALAEALARPAPLAATFEELGLPSPLVPVLRRSGVAAPFAIQTRVLPDALAGRDVLGRARTGSGKTLAFALPVVTRLHASPSRRTPTAPRALVLVPTRELAQQVAGVLEPLAHALGQRVATVVGGAPYGRQTDALARGVDVLVATPGRLVDLIERGACRLDRVEATVLDEADHMADLGFLPVVTRLLEQTPEGGQRLLFSATLDRGVSTLVDRFLTDPAVHAVAPEPEAAGEMTHRVFTVEREHKLEVATRVAGRPARTLIFVRTKHGADRLAKQLGRGGVEAAAIHGNLGQGARQRALAAFTEGRTRVLVATDVAARGIHVDDVDLVVHFDPPNDHKDYLHRSGRTARAGAEGTVVALVQPEQLRDVQRLHAAARVEASVEQVHPDHPAVVEMSRSGRPVVVRPARTEQAEPRRPHPSGGAGGRRPRQRPNRRRG